MTHCGAHNLKNIQTFKWSNNIHNYYFQLAVWSYCVNKIVVDTDSIEKGEPYLLMMQL